jgi:ABC-type sugar transport system permease subunit
MSYTGGAFERKSREVRIMDFIERIFGVSPDGGNGATEALIFMGITLVIVFLAWRRRSARTEE